MKHPRTCEEAYRKVIKETIFSRIFEMYYVENVHDSCTKILKNMFYHLLLLLLLLLINFNLNLSFNKNESITNIV